MEEAKISLWGVPVPSMSGDAVMREMLLTRLRANIERTLDNRRNLEQTIDSHVESMRLLGASWQTIGQALGMSKQAAAKKYGHLDQAISSLGLQVPDGEG